MSKDDATEDMGGTFNGAWGVHLPEAIRPCVPTPHAADGTRTGPIA